MPMDNGGNGSRWSLWSRDSVLSIGSRGSVLSVGSIGSVLSVGSVGSAGSIFSIGSFLSVGCLMSALSVWSVMSWRTTRGVLRRPGGSVTTCPLSVVESTTEGISHASPDRL